MNHGMVKKRNITELNDKSKQLNIGVTRVPIKSEKRKYLKR